MVSVLSLIIGASALLAAEVTTPACKVEVIVLGVGQDAGIPQIGNSGDPAWKDERLKRKATSLALIDHRTDKRFLFEATPDIREQLVMLDAAAPSEEGSLGLSGVFLTHAHMGHYAGLLFFGFESASTTELPVYAMPRMAEYLAANGPWSQLVSFGNISLESLADREAMEIGEDLTVTPYRVPHRDEYSETVGFMIDTPDRRVLFVPDIDSWAEWETEFGIRIEDMVERVDYAFVDATFYDDNELPGRDMSKIPHPRVTRTMELFAASPLATRAKIRFIHYNHTNPIRFPDSPQYAAVKAGGYHIAEEGERLCMAD
ncbi:MAG: MBL fold metallo-hydrolase [Pseudomonadota bacterium]